MMIVKIIKFQYTFIDRYQIGFKYYTKMIVTMKTKAADRQKILKRAAMYKNDSFFISKNIKELFEPEPNHKNISIIHFKNNRYIKQQTKISLQTTASSFSTRHQSAEKLRKKWTLNPQQHESITREQIKQLNKKGSFHAYHIRWKQSVSSHSVSFALTPSHPSMNISKTMRVIMAEWLMQLSHQLQLPKDAFYNAMHYVDKYVNIVKVNKTKYQAIGLCALFIASKLELSAHPSINVFVEAMDGTISKQELIALEQNMVFKLKFRLNPPTLYQYMVLLISLFNYFISRTNPTFVKPINCQTQAYRQIIWMLDGVHLQNDFKQFNNKQKVCLAILYICLKKQKSQNSPTIRKKIYNDLEHLKNQQQIQNIFESFLANVIQVYRKLTQLKDIIIFYRKWVKFDRPTSPEDSIEELKKIILNK